MHRPFEIWHERFSGLDRLLLGVAVAFALLFVCLRFFTPFPGDVFIKALPIAYLGLLAFKHVRGRHGLLLACALLFSTVGDVILELNPANWFVYGLAFFFVAHVFYIALFKRDFSFSALWLPVAALLALYGLVMSAFLFPRLGTLRLPVLSYIFIISGMGVFAAFRSGNKLPVFLGVLFFLLSDSCIALNRFLEPDPLTGFLIMPTYYIAQFLIAGGYIFDTEYSHDTAELDPSPGFRP